MQLVETIQAPIEVIVAGGGAAGFFAAIACAEAYPQHQVTLLEAHQPLSKVRISGGGRCNVTHACFDPAALVQYYPRGGKALRGAFSSFQPRDTANWFAKRGVQLKTEADGRMFPVTDDSSTIVNCLMRAAIEAGVQVKTAALIAEITRSSRGFELRLKSGETLAADRLLLATGSSPQGYRLAASLGHTIEKPVPSLFTFTVPDPDLRSLAGVAVDPVRARLILPEQTLDQTGALLITHWGLSGPAILKLSAWGARGLYEQGYQATLQINWLPNESIDQLRQHLLDAKQQQPKRTLAAYTPLNLPRRLWQYFLRRTGIAAEQRWAELSKSALHMLLQELHQGQYKIQGKGAFKEEFVTCGGINLKQVDFKTMQSRLCPGVFFAGEILDIDGVTGGFNFQSAWTTGWLAGRAIGQV